MAHEEFRTKYGPWALIVGGTEGIGGEFAQALAARGLNLALVARRQAQLEAIKVRLEHDHGVEVRIFTHDMSDRAQQAALLAEVGDLEIGLAVCSAAASPIGPFLDLDPATHDRLLDLNCRSALVVSHALGRKMVARKRGGIVLISSMAGYQGTAQVVHYSASKAYLRILAEGLWEELRPHHVDVLALCAGQVKTPTFENSHPQHPAWMPVPVMDPAVVVAQALAKLGGPPTMIPGLANRLASFVVHRLLPRSTAIRFYSASTRTLYPLEPKQEG